MEGGRTTGARDAQVRKSLTPKNILSTKIINKQPSLAAAEKQRDWQELPDTGSR